METVSEIILWQKRNVIPRVNPVIKNLVRKNVTGLSLKKKILIMKFPLRQISSWD